MGVPAFFRWLSRKYASIVVNCVEQKPQEVDGVKIPVDMAEPNPNDVEFDNLYLDMNGIIHPCCHPENKPAPKNEDEMMVDIFDYIDRLLAIIRPRKLLYMAIDGVAPRAKMNQQRSRRFRASQESIESREEMKRIKAELRAKGAHVPPDKPASEHFDSNCITPGTPFMFRLADCLRFYVHDRLNNDPAWKDLKVILSDANVPGEGEHKIMDYIRKQRGQPDHDPNTHHCLCGADADLIMLGLATHEPNFTIIREEFKPNQPRPCPICNQPGHEMKDCAGAPREKEGEFDELAPVMAEETQFIFLRLCVLREYLERELNMQNLPFEQNLERAIDDWVFMCFFVGNDFLPHLPSLEIREGAIDRLVRLYKKAVYKTGGYLTDNGFVNLERVQLVLSELGEAEDEIFKKRRETELDFRRRDKEKKKRARRFAQSDAPRALMGGQYAPQAISRGAVPSVQNPRQTAADMRNQSMPTGNEEAAAALRSMLTTNGSEDQKGVKRKHDGGSDEEPEPLDDVKLWEDGWKDRYYQNKFAVEADDLEFRHRVANEYVLGLCWVLRYYYQGCPSWKWYFPFHYAPFASDFLNIGDLNCDFENDTEPFKPLEQLMGVFPAASKQFLPETWQDLMDNPESAIIDFYPVDFKIDLNGKKYAWQGVALLPFVDEKRLLDALGKVYPDINQYEMSRNVRGSDRLFVSGRHPVHDFLEGLYEGGETTEGVDVDTQKTQGVKGTVWSDKFVYLSGQEIKSPLPSVKDISNNTAIAVQYKDPQYDPDFVFPAVILEGAKFPGRVLKAEDFEAMEEFTRTNGRGRGRGRGGFRGSRGGQMGDRSGYRPQLGFTRDSGYRGRESYNPAAGNRLIRGSMGSQGAGGKYGSVPPNYPQRQSHGSQGYSRNQDHGGRGGGGGYNDNRSQGHNRNQPYGGQSSRQQNQSYGYQGQQSGNQGQQSGYQGRQGGYGGGSGGHGNQQYGSQGRSQHGGSSHGNSGSGQSGYSHGGGGGRGGNNSGYGMLGEGSQYSQGRRSNPPPPTWRR